MASSRVIAAVPETLSVVHLPPDVLSLVFEYLDAYQLCQVSRVCRVFRAAVAEDIHLFRVCDLIQYSHNDGLELIVRKPIRATRVLKVSSCVEPHVFRTILDSVDALEELEIHWCHPWIREHLRKKTCARLAARNALGTKREITLPPHSAQELLSAVAEVHGPSLRSLQFGYHAESSALFFHPLPDEAVAVLASCTGLEALNLQLSAIRGRDLRVVTKALTNLTALNIGGCPFLTSEDALGTTRNLPGLQHLVLGCSGRDIYKMPNLDVLIQKFHELEFVRFATLREATLNNLVTLELSGLTLGVTDTAATALIPHLTSCRNLGLGGVSVGRETVVAIADHLPQLARLNLSNLLPRDGEQPLDSHLAALVKACSDLKVLMLAEWECLTDRGLVAIARHARGLRHLDIRGANNCTDKVLRLVRGSMPHTRIIPDLLDRQHRIENARFIEGLYAAASWWDLSAPGCGLPPLPVHLFCPNDLLTDEEAGCSLASLLH